MATDEDTTPVALRAALLRRDTTPERPKTTKSTVLCLLIACICAAWHLCTLENAADLRFFGGIGVALDLWLATHATNATVLELPCDQISRVYSAQQPIIFRSCIPEGVGLADIGYFPDEKQNLFTPCEEKLIRDFEFVNVSNNTKAIVEQVPCSPSTLQDKIDAFDAHDIRRHGNYFEVHTRMAARRERALLDAAFHTKLKLPRNFTVDRMTAATVTHFFHAGRTAVYYLHAHLDRFRTASSAASATKGVGMIPRTNLSFRHSGRRRTYCCGRLRSRGGLGLRSKAKAKKPKFPDGARLVGDRSNSNAC